MPQPGPLLLLSLRGRCERRNPSSGADGAISGTHRYLREARLRAMRGLKRHRSARILAVGHAFVQNLRRGHYDVATEARDRHQLRLAFDDLAITM